MFKTKKNTKEIPNLENSVTIYQKGEQFHIIGKFDKQVFRVRSQSKERANEYAREWLYLWGNK